ncbi:MAG: DHH family phosphoesterase [Thermodesulfobacteriota bacterium]
MNKELKRYLFIGDFDSLLLGLFSKRGEVIWVSSLDEALNQTGDFSLIILENSFFTPTRSKKLADHYPQTPLIVSNGDEHDEPPPSVRFVAFHKLLSEQIEREERLAKTELRVEELRAVHAGAKKLLILLHDHPDPDSIASALALRTLLKRNKQTAIIGHLGEQISRPENVAMIDLLEIDLVALTPEQLTDFDSIALVDVQPTFFGGMQIPEVDTVIDHHPLVDSYDAKFKEIRAEEGATSTILTKFLRASQVDISERLATALLYGIKTDTITLNRDANPDDVEAFTFLYPESNLSLLRRIERAEVPPSEMKSLGQALADHWIEDGIFFVNVGRVDREYLIPKISDFGIQVKGVEWSVAFGILGKSHLIISVRNVGYVKGAGRLVRELFKEIGSAGGHRSAAKAVIPLSNVRKTIGKGSQSAIKKWLTDIFTKAVTEKAEDDS